MTIDSLIEEIKTVDERRSELVDELNKLLDHRDRFEKSKPILQQRILEVAVKVSGIPMNELCGESRVSEVVRARHLSYWLMNRRVGLTLTACAKSFNKNHATVLHAVRKVDDYLDVYTRRGLDSDGYIQMLKQMEAIL